MKSRCVQNWGYQEKSRESAGALGRELDVHGDFGRHAAAFSKGPGSAELGVQVAESFLSHRVRRNGVAEVSVLALTFVWNIRG